MRRARLLLPLLVALLATGCMRNSDVDRGLISAAPAASADMVAQPDVEIRTVNPRAYVAQYRAPPPSIGGPYGAVDAVVAVPVAAPVREAAYTLDSGDKLRVVVFGQEGITGSYTVDASGHVSLPLIGSVPARGTTTLALSRAIAERLKKGFVREPNVTVEVEAYRPFFILGEVTTPGQYQFVPNMTAETAVAIAGGFAPRAFKTTVEITRAQTKFEAPLNYPVRPGDTIVIKERWF